MSNPVTPDMIEGFTDGYLNVSGNDLHYVIGGAGPLIVFVHGFPQ